MPINTPELYHSLAAFHLVASSLVLFRAATVSDTIWLFTHVSAGLSGVNPGMQQLLADGGKGALIVGLAGYLALELAERFRPDLWWRRIVEGCGPRWLQWGWYTVTAMLTVGLIVAVLARTGGGSTTFLYQMY